MPEADAEGDTPMDLAQPNRNERRHNFGFAFECKRLTYRVCEAFVDFAAALPERQNPAPTPFANSIPIAFSRGYQKSMRQRCVGAGCLALARGGGVQSWHGLGAHDRG